MSSPAARGPLRGLRVVELAGIGPGPFAAMVLADLGAEVLTIDRPSREPIAPDATAPEVGSTNPWDVLNRSRSRVAVDLRSGEGAALVLDLVEEADVLLEGFRPGVTERWGLGPRDCAARNPALVYGRMTGWGRGGPVSDAVGHDINYLAMAGVLAHVGRDGAPPTPPLNLVADFGGGGMLLVVGVLAALVERAASGEGQVVDAAMVDGAALLMAPLFGAWASGFWRRERGTNLLDSGAPFYDCYRCADGGYVAVGAIEPPFFAALLSGLGLSGEFGAADQHDRQRWPEMRAALEAAFAGRDRDDWAHHFEGTDACVTAVLDMGEAAHSAHATARAAFVDVGGVAQPAAAPRFSRTPAPEPTAAAGRPDPAALEGWGIDPARIDALRRAGVVG